MYKRALHAAKFVGLCLAVGVVTWGLSWLMQYLCSITIAGQHFHPNPAANRLALATIGAAVVVMVLFLLVTLPGCITWSCAVVVLLAIGLAVDWAVRHLLPGTAVSTPSAQIVYGVITAVWGILLWYIFFAEVIDRFAEE